MEIKEKDISKPFKVLGIPFMRDTHMGTLKLSQSEYINSIIRRFKMEDCNPMVLPTDKCSHLEESQMIAFDNEKLYQVLTGSLMYAVMLTRPNIGYMTQFLLQANMNQSQQDWIVAKWVVHYLKGSKDFGIIY